MIPLDPESVNVLSWLSIKSREYLEQKAEGRERPEMKRRILEELVNAYSPGRLRGVFERASKLLDSQKKALESYKYIVFDFRAVTRSRLLVGMSNKIFGKLLFEVGMSWDQNLNLPYIPASSLKGAFRAYMELNRPDVSGLLGEEGEISSVIFLNSYPVDAKKNLIAPEVTTPIYREQEGKIRESEASPNPVIYPVVNKEVTFRIIAGVRSEKRILADQLSLFMKEMLLEGIGAKTMLGYGVLEIL